MMMAALIVGMQVYWVDGPLEVARSPELQQRIEESPELFEPPSWAEPPAPEYPRQAWEVSSEGDVTIGCVVDRSGRAKECTIISEIPIGLGFGEAVLSLQDQFRWNAATFAEEPIESYVEFSVPFRFGEVVEPGEDLGRVMTAIVTDGYVTGACRPYLDPKVVRHWDIFAARMDERPTATYRPYDSLFVHGYREGRTAAALSLPESSRCAKMRFESKELYREVESALKAVEAELPAEASGAYRPLPIS